MKKLLYIAVVIFFAFLVTECKKNKNQQQQQQQDTLAQKFEEYFTDESDTVLAQNQQVTDTTVMKEDNQGNLQPAAPTDIQTPQKKIYIIVGSYRKIENAQKRKQFFEKKGYNCQILPSTGVYNRVAIAEFTDITTARQELKRYRTQLNDRTFWLLLK